MTMEAAQAVVEVTRESVREPIMYAPRDEKSRQELETLGLEKSCAACGSLCGHWLGLHRNGTTILVLCSNVKGIYRLLDSARACTPPKLIPVSPQ